MGRFMLLGDYWFAVQVVVRAEKNVAFLLRQKGYEAFLPTFRTVRKWADRKKSIEVPMFPGYVFCRYQELASGLLLSTPKVIRVVSFGGSPAPIPLQEIEHIQRVVASGTPAMPHPYLKTGERVIINAGPLAGICGVLSYVKSQCRVVLSVEMIVKAIAVEVEASIITAVAKCSVGSSAEALQAWGLATATKESTFKAPVYRCHRSNNG